MRLGFKVIVMTICFVGIFSLEKPAFAADESGGDFDPVAHERVLEVSKELRCLVCQNQSIAESNASLAVDLRKQVLELVREGKSNEEIVDYMTDRFGDYVLYDPPFKASTILLWLGPLGFLAGGFLAFYIYLSRRRISTGSAVRVLSDEEKRLADALLDGEE